MWSTISAAVTRSASKQIRHNGSRISWSIRVLRHRVVWYRVSLFALSWFNRLRFLISIRGMVQRYDRTGCYNLLQVLLRANPNKIGQCNICNTCNKKNITINNNNIRIGVHMYLRVGVSCDCYKRYKRYNLRVCWLYPRNAIVTLCYKTLRFGLFLRAYISLWRSTYNINLP